MTSVLRNMLTQRHLEPLPFRRPGLKHPVSTLIAAAFSPCVHSTGLVYASALGAESTTFSCAHCSSTYSIHSYIQQMFTEHLRCSRHWGAAVNETDPSPAPVEHRSWRMLLASLSSSQGQVWLSGHREDWAAQSCRETSSLMRLMQLVPELPANGFQSLKLH